MRIDDLPEQQRLVAYEALEAMRGGDCLSITYDDFARLVEVHAVGISTAGRPCMRVFQVKGGSISGEEVGWKMMSLDKVRLEGVKFFSLRPSAAPREGYQRGDMGMIEIFDEL